MAVGDFDSDGRPDLAVANGDWADAPRGGSADTVSVFRNTTAAGPSAVSFAGQQAFATGVRPRSVAVGDFNADGAPDLAVANLLSGTVSVLLNARPPITLSGSPATHTILNDDPPPNTAPAADAGGPYAVGEGGCVGLDASGTADAEQGGATLLYEWDFDGDSEYDDAAGIAPQFCAADLDGPTTITIGLRVTDGGGLTGFDTATVAVGNEPPAVAPVSGPAGGVRGQPLSFFGSFTDPGTPDTHTLSWEARGGSGALVASGPGTAFMFTPAAQGSYTVSFTVTDDDGGAGSASRTLTVNVVELQADPCDATKTALAAGGTSGRDRITFSPGANPGEVVVAVNGVTYGPFSPTGRLIAYGQAGADEIRVRNLALDALLFGGLGDDALDGGGGNDVLVGDGGDDRLHGRGGRDILIGGRGEDDVFGGNGDDIMIGGFTAFDGDAAALCALMQELASTRGYEARVFNLRGEDNPDFTDRLNGLHFLVADGPGRTVFDDGDHDHLAGDGGRCWFFADVDEAATDDLFNASPGEFVEDTDPG